MIDFTIAICTYNGEQRIAEVLERLESQVDTENFSWEILIIDNNSTDNTASLIREYQANGSSPYPLRYYLETRQGLAFARQCAVENARGDWVGFVDDDNLPETNWVAAAYAFSQTHPNAGAYGGIVRGEFEVDPPPGFEKVSSFFLVRERSTQQYIYKKKDKILPPGSGLVVRKQVWLENVPSVLFLKGRVGNSMLASEDLEAITYIQNAGWEVWYNPEMTIYHKIYCHRLEQDYLVSLVRGIGLARHHIRMIRLSFWQRFLFFPLYFALDLWRFSSYYVKHGYKKGVDLGTTCKIEFLYSTLVSPFFLSRKYLFEAKNRLLEKS
ncbi:glycosyltransferase family 2 protein [Lusitaniella coriacea LEGE 07157]|uniref:Glycosyltransferase family 2 protein n=1 Tax=Lusitaniella coriacea LEGE 07157 TaxID=945747 RepID=A0A8J7B6K8_9CYAN|nr:hormogonium polysaccharide biosynthesis glycosyltransferase HpsE [Lusitaniella coriacea]MBE9114499.1 glycosyltransferase family 2 protein [Lusitaniella coriacea LEGE 07157]